MCSYSCLGKGYKGNVGIMNYYSHHIGDFNNATRHLTRLERLLYREAIELYYDTETQLTLDFDKLSRRLLANSEEEKEALKAVLDEFFTKTDDGYFNDRCDKEITKYQSFAEAGKRGAAIRWDKGSDRGANRGANATPIATNNHKPITNNQEILLGDEKPIASKSKGKVLSNDWVLPKAWGEWAKTEKPNFSNEQIRLIAETFKDHWLANANQANAKKSDWEATWRNWVRRQTTPPVINQITEPSWARGMI